MNENPLTEVAMQIIIHAGDARERATEALRCAKQGEFIKAGEAMAEARALIAEAHHAQTDTIQSEARGEQHDINLLFIHSQDTLMTIKSEVRLTQELIEIYEKIAGGSSNE